MIIFDIISSLSIGSPDSNFAASNLLFILSRSKVFSNDVVILVKRNCDGSLPDISFITSISPGRYGVF